MSESETLPPRACQHGRSTLQFALVALCLGGLALGYQHQRQARSLEKTRAESLARRQAAEANAMRARDAARRAAEAASPQAAPKISKEIDDRIETAFRKSENAVKYHVEDQGSLQLRNVLVYTDYPAREFDPALGDTGTVEIVCGEANARDRTGDYAGFIPFYWVSGSETFSMPPRPASMRFMQNEVGRQCEKAREYQQRHQTLFVLMTPVCRNSFPARHNPRCLPF